MAIIKELELKSGIKVENAYFMVSNVTCDKTFMEFTVNVFKDKASRNENRTTIDNLKFICNHDISINSSNVIKQAYEYMKTLDEYKNAIDDFDY